MKCENKSIKLHNFYFNEHDDNSLLVAHVHASLEVQRRREEQSHGHNVVGPARPDRVRRRPTRPLAFRLVHQQRLLTHAQRRLLYHALLLNRPVDIRDERHRSKSQSNRLRDRQAHPKSRRS